ncbi:Na+/H+ antiporter NhaC family protein [Algoriphagus sp. CAU 1675]|uniref:YfcC family protein n=1 Tax=Algoriphagus sp. CAU 1675 TaxID=3032597 RepID=UPI0023DC95FD|nr:Na+/H+ antiporter NhaC family protein [Algoriphagus sp. CAU 1675]MDF2158276.1 Na+/H+ antiporter NhaC family protein [Algoriphagus sp. CAU 1675]
MKLSFPHPLIILLIFIILSGIGTYLISPGQYERSFDPITGKEVVLQGTFETVENEPLGISDIALAIPEGIIMGADIMVLILLIGGAFYVIEKTGALQLGIEALIYRFKGNSTLLLGLLSVAFSIAGATIAMQEEIIAMVPILMLLSSKLNYDKRSIIALTLGSSLIGQGFSPINPFNALLAQKLVELDINEGLAFRMIFFVIALIIWTAIFIKKGKSQTEDTLPKDFKPNRIDWRSGTILFLCLGGIVFMGYGITQHEWGFNEMSAFFFVVGISCGLLGGLGINGTAKTYTEGFGEMIFAGVIVGLARSIYLILEKGMIIDSIIHGLFTPLEALPAQLAVIGLYLTQAILHLPVPSTSGQAVLTMPLAAPLTDLLGMSRQITVLTYQYAASIMDVTVPTNGGMMAIIAAAGVKYNDWIRYIWKSWLLLLLLGLISIFIALIWF